ncbi:MAG: endonuclease/exonuclease/phosphatase family protein [Actinomycetota bacterium]
MFWNLQKKDLRQRIARIVERDAVDALLLAESLIDDGDLVEALNRTGHAPFSVHHTSSSKVKFYSRWPSHLISQAFSDPIGSLTIWRLHIGPPPGVLLASVHFPSKVGWSAQSQSQQAVMLADDVRRAEQDAGHRRTVLVGDMNMNPFDDGMVGALGFNAVMSAALARPEGRTVQGRVYPFFYNPMWAHFGDRTAGPPGTHYFHPAEAVVYYWNIFDQVLLRPSLVKNLESVHILDGDGSQSLLDLRGVPDRGSASDHLPVLFTLDI